jgi:hypothetical protein
LLLLFQEVQLNGEWITLEFLAINYAFEDSKVALKKLKDFLAG